jgi:hypothetical protein
MFNWSSTLPDTDVTRDSVSRSKSVNNNKPQWPQKASQIVLQLFCCYLSSILKMNLRETTVREIFKTQKSRDKLEAKKRRPKQQRTNKNRVVSCKRINKLLEQVYVDLRLKSSLQKFSDHYHELVDLCAVSFHLRTHI